MNLASDNIGDVVKDTDIIMVVVPAFAHAAIAERCAPYLKDGQIVLLNPTTNIRYITEDVPMSIVPIAEFGRVFGVKTTATDALIDLANVIFKIDFRKTGRNLKRLGLENLTLDEIRNVFIEGTSKHLF